MVPDYHAQGGAAGGGVMRFIGHRHLAKHGRNGAFHRHADNDAVTVDIEGFEGEYLQEVRAGSLVTADEESARLCGVKFVPRPTNPTAAPAVAAVEELTDV